MTRYAWHYRLSVRGVRVCDAADRRALAWLRRHGHAALLMHLPTTQAAFRRRWSELERAGTIRATQARETVEAAEGTQSKPARARRMTMPIKDDAACADCGAEPQQRTCSECGASAALVDCGHMAQPRPIAAGRADGSSAHLDFCQECAESACAESADTAELIDSATDEGGIIQAADVVRLGLAPGQPELHHAQRALGLADALGCGRELRELWGVAS